MVKRTKRKKLCKNCRHMRSFKTGIVSSAYYCGIAYDEPVGIYPWIEKPHPRCPLRKGDE